MRHPNHIHDVRPMGVNNLNQLVHYNLGSESFDVVADVQGNLTWLHQLYSTLPQINVIQKNLRAIENLGSKGKELEKISKVVCEIKKIADALDLIRDILPNLKAFTKNLESVQNQLGYHNRKANDLDHTRTEAQRALQQAYEVASRVASLDRVMAHLECSDSVELAIFTDIPEHKRLALAAIEFSERMGNDETVNRLRLDSAVGEVLESVEIGYPAPESYPVGDTQ